MDVKQTLYELSMERFEVFKSQDPEDGDFDVVFEIDGKRMYANKFILCPASSTFKSMLSKRWTTPEEPVKIEAYSFDDFKEFLTFIYSGECSLTTDNILAMVDISEFYAVKVFKKYCEKFLIKMLDFGTVYEMIEHAQKYSMADLKQRVNQFISRNISSLLKSEKFCYLPKSVITVIVESCQKTPHQNELFGAVYKWAETCALELQKDDNNLDLNDIIKNELSDILPFINFKIMDQSFLISFVVRKSFLFTDEQLKSIIYPIQSETHVQVIDGNGKIMKGRLHCADTEKVVDAIKSLKNFCCEPDLNNARLYYIWKTNLSKPSSPSKLIKNAAIRGYLILNNDGDLSIIHHCQVLQSDYLLAEMSVENGFILDEKCEIEIV